MKIKNLFAVAALFLASTSTYAAITDQVISPHTLVDAQGINYNVVEVYKNQNIAAGEINTVTVAITNDFAGATLNIPDEVTLTLNAGSKDFNKTPIEGAITFRVVGIQDNAFRNNRNITTVNIGKYVEEIGDNAFNSCTGVTAINFAEESALDDLGDYCFGNTPKLKTLNFDNCASLTDLSASAPFWTSGDNKVNNYLTTLKLNKVEKIGNKLSNLTALSSVAFTALEAVLENAFSGDAALTTLTLPAKCLTINENALQGSSVATLTINGAEGSAGGAQDIKANVYGTDTDVLQSLTFKGTFTGKIAAAAFSSTKLTSVTFGTVNTEADDAIAEGAFVLADAASTITITKISKASFAADAFTGPAHDTNKVALNIGEVAVGLTNRMVSANVGAATTGKVSKALNLAVFGDAATISFGQIAKNGSITGLGADNETLTSVTFTSTVAAAGIPAGAFEYCLKLATVVFQGNLEANAVATTAFGNSTRANKVAGFKNIKLPENPYRLTVTYKPTVYTAAFAATAFTDEIIAAGAERVVLISNMTYVGNADYVALNDVVKSFAGETREIEMLAPAGQSTWYGKFVADGCNYAIATTNADGKKVVVYEAYLDENDDTQITSIVMLPLTRDGNFYIVKERQAVIVRAWGEGNITAEATTADDTHNYYKGNKEKNVIRYYQKGTNYNYLDASVDASTLYDECVAAPAPGPYKYMFAVKNLANNAFQWGQFEATAGLMPPYTFYIYTHYLGENPASGRLNIIWADGEDDEATAIETVKNVAEDGEMFNLAGQKVDANYKGVVIKNGKKVILK